MKADRDNARKKTKGKGLNIPIVTKRYRPKDGKDALNHLKRNIEIEVVDSYAFEAAKILEEHAGFSFNFKLSRWNKGWTGFTKQ